MVRVLVRVRRPGPPPCSAFALRFRDRLYAGAGYCVQTFHETNTAPSHGGMDILFARSMSPWFGRVFSSSTVNTPAPSLRASLSSSPQSSMSSPPTAVAKPSRPSSAFPAIDGVVLNATIHDVPCETIVATIRKAPPRVPIIVIQGPGAANCPGASHFIDSFDPAHLLELLHKLFPRQTRSIKQQDDALKSEENRD